MVPKWPLTIYIRRNASIYFFIFNFLAFSNKKGPLSLTLRALIIIYLANQLFFRQDVVIGKLDSVSFLSLAR